MENIWNKVYYLSNDEFKRALERNEKEYNEIVEKDYDTIDACVNHAIENGNHVAFAHYYYKKAKTENELFVDALKILIDKYNVSEEWNNMQIIHDEYWRAIDFDYTEYEKRKGIFYKEAQLKKWRDGDNMPPKDIIVQMGLWCGFSYEETDRLLALSGNERLYVLNLEDLIALYYLDYYCNNGSECPTSFERVKNVKKIINKYMNYYDNKDELRRLIIDKKIKDYDELTEEEKELVDKMGVVLVGKDKKKIDDVKKPDNEKLSKLHLYCRENESTNKMELFQQKYNRLVYSEKLNSWNIIDEYEQLYKEYGLENTGVSGVTTQVEEGIRECKTEEEFKSYIAEKQNAFEEKRYGYLKLMIDGLNDVDAYKKNYIYTDYSLDMINLASKEDVIIEESNDVEMIDEKVADSGNMLFKSKFCEEMYVRDKKTENNEKMRVFNSIWNTKNAMCKDDYGLDKSYDKAPTERKSIRQYLEGRYESKEKNKYYEYDLGNKGNVIRFALTVGKDEARYIFRFLEKSGFWTDDMVNKANNGQYDNDCFNKLDLLIIYTLSYRSVLIDKWIQCWAPNESKEEKNNIRNEILRNFPTIRLLMMINRDIQLSTLFRDNAYTTFNNRSENIVFPVQMDYYYADWFGRYINHQSNTFYSQYKL